MELYNKGKQSGFTLIELMIAMVVCVLAMLSVLLANTTIQKTTEEAYENSVVAQDINEVIEQMRNAANAADDTSVQTDVIAAGSAAVTSVKSLPSNYSESISISYADQSADPLDATITATWKLRGLRTKSLSMGALITKRT